MQQSGVLHTLSRAGDVTNSTFKDKPLAGALTHIPWQPPLRVTLEEPAGHLLCQESWQGGWVSMEKHNDPEKTTPALFLSKGVHKITTKIQDHGLEKLAGELWEKPPATGTRHVLPAQLSRACPAIAQSSEGQ